MSNRRRIAWIGLALVVSVCAWRLTRGQPRRAVPDIPLEGAAPALVEAVEKAKDRIAAEPDSAEAWGGLGDLLNVSGLHGQAGVCYAAASELAPAEPQWPFLHANILMQSGRSREAIPLLERSAERCRTRAESLAVRFVLCGTLIEEGMLNEADARVREFESLEPGSDRSIGLRATLARTRDDRDEAKIGFERLLTSPHFARTAHRMLAGLCVPPRSSELLAAAEKLPPDTPLPNPFTAHLRLVRVESPNRLNEYLVMMQRDPEGAFAFLRQIAADATDSEYPSMLGQAFMQRGRLPEAADSFRHAIRLNSKNATAHLMLADVLETLARSETQPDVAAKLLDEALAEADAALKLQAGSSQAHATRGRVLWKRKKSAEAIAAFREAVTCQPESAAMHRELGEALASSGDVPAGIASLETAATLAPNDEAVRAALAKWKK